MASESARASESLAGKARARSTTCARRFARSSADDESETKQSVEELVAELEITVRDERLAVRWRILVQSSR